MGVIIYSCCETLGRTRRLRDITVAAAMATVVATRKSGKSADAGNSGMTITDPSTTASMFTWVAPSDRYEIAFGDTIVTLVVGLNALA